MRKASLEMQRIVAWVLGVVLALVVIIFISTQLSADGGGLFSNLLERLDILG